MTELTINQALQKGIEAHKAGQIEEADRLYTAILKAQPKHPDANHNMGVLAVGVGKVQEALPFFKTALEANPATAQFWLSYIDVLIKLERLADAKAVLDLAKSRGAKGDGFDKLDQRLNKTGEEPVVANNITKKLDARQPNILDNLTLDQAISLAKKKAQDGSPKEAKRIHQDILMKFPKNKRAIDGLKGLAGRPAGKASSVQDAPKDELQSLMALYNNGQLDLVVEQAQVLTRQYPKAFAVWNLIGISAAQIGQLAEAIYAFKKVLAIKPNYAQAYNNMGNALQQQGKLEEAIEAYIKALAIKPDNAGAYYNMGVTLKEQGKLEEATEAYKKALAIKPDYVEAYNNMGVALNEQGKLAEAIEAYNQALAINPDDSETRHNLSFPLLATKDFDRGFKQNEWRWGSKKQLNSFLKSTKPMWNGKTKQRVLLWPEQGIGDEIMFSSIIPDLYSASSQILIKCDKRLIPLFKRSFPSNIVYYQKEWNVPEDEYDVHIPMGSLPMIFRKSLNSFKKVASGFLKYDAIRSESIKAQLAYETSKKLIGISWKTESKLDHSYTRNIHLASLARALSKSNTKLVCLQYGDVSEEIETLKEGFGLEVIKHDKVDNKNDIDGLASLIAACDMVVTIDNLTVHLAGALGVKTKLMLPYKANWRWGTSDDSSYWYDSVQLYRQSKVSNWDPVLDKLKSITY